ncbi:MAG: DNA polymerase III subunit chi [Parasphingorhabdus sp.]
MQVDFYHLTRDPAEKLVPVLASKCLDADVKILIISDDGDQRTKLSGALWGHSATSFLANDFSGSEQEAHQPILISNECHPANAAEFILITDGKWRRAALDFKRTFYLFTDEKITEARTAWRELSANSNVTPRYWKQDGSRWVEGP